MILNNEVHQMTNERSSGFTELARLMLNVGMCVCVCVLERERECVRPFGCDLGVPLCKRTAPVDCTIRHLTTLNVPCIVNAMGKC